MAASVAAEGFCVPRPVILTFVRHFLPGFKAGGPIRSISNMVEALHGSFDFRIFTSDRDYGDSKAYPGLRHNEWINCGANDRFYADADHRRLTAIAAMIRQVDPDIVYINSLFDWKFAITPLLLRRIGAIPSRAAWVVAPRGECSRGAMALKRSKKKAFLRLAQLAGIHRGLIWQASSPHEADDIQREVGVKASEIVVAPNLTEPVGDHVPRASGASSRLSICFLSRITPKKNLAFALEALAKAKTTVDFHIYGPVEDEAYAAACRSYVAQCPRPLHVTWHGHLAHDQVRTTLRKHDLFFFPTLGENFGHVIFESLAAGVPVLVSDQTPWRDLDQRGAGWVRALNDAQDFANVIDTYANASPSERALYSKQAHEYARSIAESSASVEANRALFQKAMTMANGAASA